MVPTRVAHLEGARSISYGVAGATHFIREDGSLGRVFHDPNTPTATLIPEDVVVPNRVLQVSSSLGLYSDGTVFSLYESAPDAGEYACQNTPVRVAGISDAVDICAAFESLIRQASGEYFVFSADDYSVERVELP